MRGIRLSAWPIILEMRKKHNIPVYVTLKFQAKYQIEYPGISGEELDELAREYCPLFMSGYHYNDTILFTDKMNDVLKDGGSRVK